MESKQKGLLFRFPLENRLSIFESFHGVSSLTGRLHEGVKRGKEKNLIKQSQSSHPCGRGETPLFRMLHKIGNKGKVNRTRGIRLSLNKEKGISHSTLPKAFLLLLSFSLRILQENYSGRNKVCTSDLDIAGNDICSCVVSYTNLWSKK